MARKRGEGGAKARRRQINHRRAADDSKCHQPLPLGDQEGDRGEVGFHREDFGERGCEAVRRPSLDFVPKGVKSRNGYSAGCE